MSFVVKLARKIQQCSNNYRNNECRQGNNGRLCKINAEIKQEGKNGNSLKVDESVFSSSKKPIIECYKCHKKGLKSSECWSGNKNFRGRGRGNNNDSKTTYRNIQQFHMTQNDRGFNFVAMKEEQIFVNNIKEWNMIDLIIDSGATENLVKDNLEEFMHETEMLDREVNIKIANGQKLKSVKKGILTIYCDGKRINIEALIVPGIYHNIISVRKLTKKNFKVIFDDTGVKITSGKKIWICRENNGLYTLSGNLEDAEAHINIHCLKTVWHQRLRHLNRKG